MATHNPIAASYEEAIKIGLKRYFTGQPCERAGHIYFRNLKRHCIKCKNELEKIRVSHGEAKKRLEQYRERNKEKYRLDAKRRYRENPEPYKQRAKRWAELNPDLYKEHSRRSQATYRGKNREKSHIDRRMRRTRKFAGGGSHTVSDVAAIFKSQNGKCAYCRQKVTMDSKHVDHIIPLAKGGGNDRRNLQILCKPCNLRKHAKDPIDYARSQGMLL